MLEKFAYLCNINQAPNFAVLNIQQMRAKLFPGLLPLQWLIFADMQANGCEDLELLFHREKEFERDKLIYLMLHPC